MEALLLMTEDITTQIMDYPAFSGALVGVVTTLLAIMFFLVRHVVSTHNEFKKTQEHFAQIERKYNLEIQELKSHYTDKLIVFYKNNSEKLLEVLNENQKVIKDMRMSIDRNTDAQTMLKDVITTTIFYASKGRRES
jgi:hypothetical protein